MKKETNTQKILTIMKNTSVIRPRDLDAYNIPRRYLHLMYKQGLLHRSSKGLYELPDADVSEFHTLVQVCTRIPRGVICLLSALRFHDLTSQQPHEIWLALKRTQNQFFKIDDFPVQTVRFSAQSYSAGVEEHHVEGVRIRVYGIAKTVADCFKFRNRIGLDVSLEALRQCIRERRCSSDDLWHYAKICRVSKVMRPYLEALS